MSRYRHFESLPLMNNQPTLEEHNMSDEELDDLMQTPLALEGVLEHMRYHPHTVTKQQYYKGTLFFSLLSLVVGVIISYVSCGFLCDSQKITVKILNSEESHITNKIISYVDEESIRIFLRNLTRTPLLGGTTDDQKSARYVQKVWQEQGLEVKVVPYKVLLSYPRKDKPNKISVVSNTTKTVLFKTSTFEKQLDGSEDKTDAYPPFLAYSAATKQPIIGDLIYVNYGRLQDFKKLASVNIDPKGKIAIIRYGKIYRGNKIKNAEKYGVQAVILYCDPKDYAPEGPNNVYPNSEYLPPSGVQRGTLLVNDGDPTTPFYPSIESAYRIPKDSMDIPQIPAHVISYSDASKLLKLLRGPKVPDDWAGTLNLTYHYGPGFTDESYQLVMEVNTYNQFNTTYNVIATILGKEEPDRYVIVGNHRDAWTFGGTDPSSGTASMLEMSRVMGKLLKEGWRPRRSIMFCSWGSEEYGLIGSTEWVEENQKKLVTQAVAYLNVDISVTGNYTLLIKSVPLLFQVFLNSAKKIPNPNPKEHEKGRLTVYDTWLETSASSNSLPKIDDIGAGSDFSPFIHSLGISSGDLTFTCKEDLVDCYPVYHTMYDNFHLQDKILDNGFHYNKALTQMWAEATRALADSPILPFSVKDLSTSLSTGFERFQKQHEELLTQHNISLGWIDDAIKKFSLAAENFEKLLKNIDIQNPLAVRIVNDALMQLERAFIDYQGLPLRKNYRHVIFAPDATDAYSGSILSGLVDIMHHFENADKAEMDNLHAKANEHISAIAFHIHAATGLLSKDF